MADLIALKFLAHHDRYNAGEVAGFDKRTAELLITKGIAKPYDEAEEAALAKAEAEKAEALASREAELDAREAALAAREAALSSAGDPPRQGEAQGAKK